MYSIRYILQTADCIAQITNCTVNIALLKLHTAHCTTLNIVQRWISPTLSLPSHTLKYCCVIPDINTACSTLHIKHYINHTAHCTLHTAHCTLHSIHRTLYSMLYTIQINFTLYCTFLTTHSKLHCSINRW